MEICPAICDSCGEYDKFCVKDETNYLQEELEVAYICPHCIIRRIVGFEHDNKTEE